MQVGILTCEALLPYVRSPKNPLYTHDDQLLVNELESRGHTVRALVWRNPDVDLSGLDIVLLRSPWDYHKHREEFFAFLDRLEGLGIRVENPLSVVRDNLDKHYLGRMGAQGASIVPTYYLPQGHPVTLADAMRQHGLAEAVVKPTISGGAHNTFRLSLDEAVAFQPRFAELLAASAFMLQPFLPEILTLGEWSFIYFRGKYSHCVLKRGKPGDFRVQDDHGGKVHFETPPTELRAQADAVAAQVAPTLAYARIDGVWTGERFLLMEAELIEPELFFRSDPASTGRFCEALGL